MTIFDIVYNLLKPGQTDFFNSLTDEELDLVNPYLINRFLATNPELLPIIGEIERYTVKPKLTKKQYLTLMYKLLPKGFFKLNFPKKVGEEDSVNVCAEFIRLAYNCSRNESFDYYKIMKQSNTINSFMLQYGIDIDNKQQIKKMVKLIKD